MATSNLEQISLLRKHLDASSPDMLRQMLQDFAESVMCADASALCGAGLGVRDAARTSQRNGYRLIFPRKSKQIKRQ